MVDMNNMEELIIILVNKQDSIVYMISASYKDTSFGIDVEDEIVNKYTLEVADCSIHIKEYQQVVHIG